MENNPEFTKFLCSFNNEQYEDTILYNYIIYHIEKAEKYFGVWKLQRIIAHEGPLQTTHPDYKRAKYNVIIEWETGEITAESFSIISSNDPVKCAIYAKQTNLLEFEG